jgi:ABC-2 type transport system ATP-binding protein
MRCEIAASMLHEPSVLFLDEPTQGLDPVAARDLRALVKSLQERGVTILLTTHNMLEADELCDRIVVINRGLVIAEGTPDSLKRGVEDVSVIELEVSGATAREVAVLNALADVDSVAVEEREAGQLLRVQTSLGARAVPMLVNGLDGVAIARINVRDATLEDAYVRLVSEP